MGVTAFQIAQRKAAGRYDIHTYMYMHTYTYTHQIERDGFQIHRERLLAGMVYMHTCTYIHTYTYTHLMSVTSSK
jgi:hypothetical protein